MSIISILFTGSTAFLIKPWPQTKAGMQGCLLHPGGDPGYQKAQGGVLAADNPREEGTYLQDQDSGGFIQLLAGAEHGPGE